MSKGENIFKRKDGRWEARYVKGRESSGKIKYGFCYGKTYKEAKDKATKCKAMLLNGEVIPEKKAACRFASYCDDWLWLGKNRLKESTYVKYEAVLACHIKPKLGGCIPTAITTENVEAFTNELLHQEHLAPKTVKDVLVVMRSVLKYTAKHTAGGLPVIDIVYPREKKKEMRVLNMEEQKELVDYLKKDMDSCKFGVLLALLTGIRIGELCALKWEAVSLEEKSIRITKTMQRLKNNQEGEAKTKIVIDVPKSEASIRSIPLTDYAIELISKIQENFNYKNTMPRNGEYSDDEKGSLNPEDAYILTGTEHYMEPRALQYRFGKYVKECGLTDVHFHTLRHTFATRCVEVGFEVKSLSEILGHSSITITLERYVHSSMDLKRNNMSKLEAVGL